MSDKTDEELQELIKKAENGDIQTQYKLGGYYWGNGFIRDKEKAEFWLLKAAEQRLSEAQYQLGVLYNHAILFKKNPNEKALTWSKIEYWWLKAAEQENIYAQYMLGVKYDSSNKDNDSIIKKDDEKAVYYFKKAAENGNDKAQLELGCCYMDGRGVGTDWEKAKFWCNRQINRF